ncbi:MAG: 4-(cytidine 5'-diphospho)-2-C-methyl-D-erythritol kinase [Candidatus Omnitrophica bacterium]|nr:4-(cytidine 5'-diphospho)-2-C-methyl-D-erythritol kinase [Candidatus Omnitrophota bacterium]
MVLKSYAKLNLYLAVLSRRPDNYHTLHTLFERIDLHDSVVLKKRKDAAIKISCSSPGIPVDEGNLCYQSALLLQEQGLLSGGVEIAITKRIPAGAGLGGGSSNAAAVLSGLNTLYKLGLNRRKLLVLARKIGADVPFFLYNTSFAVGTGRGDRIRPRRVSLRKPLWHVLIVPQLTVSTGVIFKKWDTFKGLTIRKGNAKLLSLYIDNLKKNNLSQTGDFLFNGLEPVTEALYPEVKRCKNALRSEGVSAVMMSGSGPAVFGIVSSRKEAECLAQRLKRRKASWRVFVARTR